MSGTDAAVLDRCFLGAFEGPGEGARSPSLADRDLVIDNVFPGDGKEVRLGRGRGLSGGIVEVTRKPGVEKAVEEEGGVEAISSEELEFMDKRWLKLAPSRSVSDPDRTSSSRNW